eukprot:GFUD01008223.1.p1 GENE.GFUD01008223.1~~GFUD01008223.1.p1  ORF type:complete len:324 (+),score=109.21 GFUD01008223.1:75-974(+)
MVANMIANQKKKGLKSSKSYAADKKKTKKSANKTGSKTGNKSDANKEIGRDIGRSQKPKKKVEKKIVLPESSDEEEMSDDAENAVELPTAETDPKLQKMIETSQKAEKESEKKNPVDPKAAFLSISTPTEDGQVPKVPSYSNEKNRGVIYISHVPHGFYEKQMREFFGQFGTVTNLRLGRSKRTGKSCGYAFVEFKYKEVAQVVSETMNNYLMFDKILKCSIVPKERMSPAIFRGKIRPHKPPGKAARVAAKKLHNSVKVEETVAKRQVRQVKKVNRSLKKLKEAGIEYNFKIAEMASG